MSNLMLTPFRDMLSLRDAMDRLFDESFVRPFGGATLTSGYGLALDIQADKDDYVIRANVPGLKADDLHIEVMDNTVTVSGELRSERREEKDNYLLQERRYGQFSRTVSLPTTVNPGKAEAIVDNGVLTLRLPKAEEAKPKAITVKAK